MNIDALAKHEQFRRFFSSISPCMDAYVHRIFTFTAITCAGTSSILHARLHLSQSPRIAPRKPFRTKNLFSGECELSGAPRDTEQLFLSWLAQRFVTPGGIVKFIPEADGRISPWSQLNDTLKVLPEPAAAKLILQGVGSGLLLREISSEIESELIESDSAFRNLKDWLHSYELNLSDSDYSRIEVIADRVASIKEPESSVKEDSATLVVRVAPRTNPEALRLKVRNSDPNGAAIQEVTSGKDLKWLLLPDGNQEATWCFKVHQPAIFHCLLVYKGWIQQEAELFDPKAVPNRARLMVEATDVELKHLHRLLTTTTPDTGSGRAFEAAVHLLLHLLGFKSGYTGALKHMEKEVDVIAIAPSGDTLAVECKTVPPSIDVLDRLISRTEALRSSVSTSMSGISQHRIVPVLAVPNAWNEITHNARKHARMNGVVLLFREELEKLIERTRFTPDADGTLREWLEMPLLRILTGEESI